MDIPLRLLIVFALLAANGFFVAAEFALVTARKTRLEALSAQGNRSARAVLKALEDPNRFISACQLGITMASLALGWVGEEAVASLLEAPLAAILPLEVVGLTAHGLAIAVAFAIITFLHISLGEQLPKMIALQRGEETALLTVRPTNLVGLAFRPFIALLYGFIDVLLRLMGLRWEAEHHQAYSVEDLKALIRSSRGGNGSADDTENMAERALDFSGLHARQVMVPRTEMVAVPAGVSLSRLGELMGRHEHSRYPVYESNPDNIIGVISAKHLVAMLSVPRSENATFDVRLHMSPPLFIPETMPAYRVLAELKQQRTHLAIVVDEYGATAGIVSLRDLLDRIAGELRDEAEAEPPEVQWLADGSALVDGLALLSDVEEQFHMTLSDSDYDTLGGFVFGRLGRRPSVGDAVEVAGHRLAIEEIDGLRVARVRVSQLNGLAEEQTRGTAPEAAERDAGGK
ncbi:MAG: HlyC/CorC family transporter [Chloroflexi bacterium]|nr:HlyC/CorC family transporter [Chloroflexota bacterium]